MCWNNVPIQELSLIDSRFESVVFPDMNLAVYDCSVGLSDGQFLGAVVVMIAMHLNSGALHKNTSFHKGIITQGNRPGKTDEHSRKDDAGMAKQEKFIQIGVTALRDPATGDFLPAVPLYIKAEDGAPEAEQSLIDDLGRLFAERMRRYRERRQEEGVAV